MMYKRCKWCNLNNQKYIEYHDHEWGVLNLDEKYLFEMLILESFQAGLSWECVLNKRNDFRKALDNFNIDKIIYYDEEKINELLNNKNLIRNKLKIKAMINNARIFKNIQKEYGSFKDYLLGFSENKIIYEKDKVSNKISDAISLDLQKRKMKFVGTKIIYSYLQAIGIINSHEENCFLNINNIEKDNNNLYNIEKENGMIKLVLVRHGQSIWNLENRFTGWTDVGLSEKGINEAIEAGKLLKEKGYTFDAAYTSFLKRANDTLDYILKELDLNIPIHYSWRLNERHYGALQGLNKDETKEKYGEEQVHLWRRSADVRPPELTIDDERYPGNDLKYKDLKKDELPLTENLLDTVDRVVKYFESDIKKDLQDNKRLIIVAHGNSLRGLMKYLDNLSNDEVVSLEIATGRPICYELDENLKPIRHYYVDEE